MSRRTPWAEYERLVGLYTEAGATETLQRIVTALSRLSRRLDVFYKDHFDDLDISRADWMVLQALAIEGRGGHSNPSRLAEAVGVSASTMTHRLDLMVDRDLVKRIPDPDNRTRMTVSLTTAGWDAFRDVVLDSETEESGIFAPLSETERATLARLLEKALAAQEGDKRRRPAAVRE